MTPGRIDIHTHLLPGIDDGCQSVADSFDCVGQLQQAGYTGVICTPHIDPKVFPENTPANVRHRVAQLDGQLRAAGVNFRLWAGGELRLYADIADWLAIHGTPTLAGTNRVLFDFWAPKFPDWVIGVVKSLIDTGHQPILAHPERLACFWDQPQRLDELLDMGVWLQGNYRCMTGGEGIQADKLVRELLEAGKYQLMALDMHTPSCLPDRLDGLNLLAEEYGQELADHFSITAPRRLVLGDVG